MTKTTKTTKTTRKPKQIVIEVVERRVYRVPVDNWSSELAAKIKTGKITDELEEWVGDLEYHFGPEEAQIQTIKVAR